MGPRKRSLLKLLLAFVCLVLLFPTAASAASKQVQVMYVGESKKVGYKVQRAKGTSVKVKASGNKSTIYAKSQGEATLKYYSGEKLKKTVEVLVLKDGAIKYNTSKLTLKAGKSKAVKCKAYKACGVTYKSSNKKVATVGPAGKIRAVAKGTCTITVKVSYKGKAIRTFKKKVTVTGGTGSFAGDSGSVTLSKISATCTKASVKEGYRFSLNDFNVYGHYSDGSKKKLRNYSVSTSYSSKDGYYTVTVKSGGKETAVKVPVIKGSAQEEGQPSGQKPSGNQSSGKPSGNQSSGSQSGSNTQQQATKKAVGIEVSCSKTEVTAGYEFQLSDFTVYTLYSDGSKSKALSYGFKALYRNGSYTVTVTSGSFSKTLTIPAKPAAPTVTKVHFELLSGTVKVGEDLKPSQIKVTAVYSDGSEKEVHDYTCDFTPKKTPGRYAVHFTWGEAKSTLYVTVVGNAPSLVSADVSYARNYICLDETPVKEDIIVMGKYSDGSTKRIEDFTFTFIPATEHKGIAKINVTVNGMQTTLSVRAYDRNIPIKLVMTADKTVLKVNEALDPATITLKATYCDGRTGTEKDFEIDFTPKSEPGEYPVTIRCKGFTFNFTVTVI